jgi:hypothetical protein
MIQPNVQDYASLGKGHNNWRMLTSVRRRTTPAFFAVSGPSSHAAKAEFLRRQVHVNMNNLSLYDHHDDPPVPFTKLESGWIGYVGRVNDETGQQDGAMEICTFTTYAAGSERICCWIRYPRNVPYVRVYPVIDVANQFMGENLRIVGMEKQLKARDNSG